MANSKHPGGLGRIGEHAVSRIGYGAMQLGEEVALDEAAAVLRRAVELGVNHIDTASFYSAGEVNRRLRQVLSPYPEDLIIVSKVGAEHVPDSDIPMKAAQKPAELRAAVEMDLTQLGLDCLPVVNLRRLDLGPGLTPEGDQIVDLDDQLAEMVALRDEGKIGGIGISSTRSVAHLEQNAAAGELTLDAEALARLDNLGNLTGGTPGTDAFTG